MNTAINITPVKDSRIKSCDFDNIIFGRVYSDHMFSVDFRNGKWSNPEILPYGNIPVSPATSALHYGQSIFEGMKAYKDSSGKPQLFRPLDNLKRLNESARRMCMPELPEHIFLDALSQLVTLDQNWIPTKAGSGLYLRPFMFATDDFVGVRPSESFKFMIFCCPVNEYYQKPLKVKVENKYVRSFDGGAGYAKAAGNYGISMLPTRIAHEQGYDQIIWMDGREFKYVEESGTINLFFVIGNKLLTPELDGNILKGVTRDSCIQLAREKGYEVEERKISISEIIEGIKNGTLTEAFGTGTAATIAHIITINHEGKDHQLPPVENREVGPWLFRTIENIKTSKVPDNHGWVYKL